MKILCVLYDDPKGGMPESYPLTDLPKLEKYPDGMTLPSPKGRDFNAGCECAPAKPFIVAQVTRAFRLWP